MSPQAVRLKSAVALRYATLYGNEALQDLPVLRREDRRGFGAGVAIHLALPSGRTMLAWSHEVNWGLGPFASAIIDEMRTTGPQAWRPVHLRRAAGVSRGAVEAALAAGIKHRAVVKVDRGIYEVRR